ncbi:MAG: twin-arginine translocase subunit TatC [Bacteroidetes bacterium]|nr:twin-arginine translocase subunit TatC [Bacteroidota bacterium]
MSKNEDSGEKEMSFLQHLESLRWVIIRSVVAIVLVGIVAFLNVDFVFNTVLLGPKNSDFLTYRLLCALVAKFNLSDALCITEIPFRLISTNISGQFITHMMVSFQTGLIVAFPYILFEIWNFIKPALHDNEKKYSSGFILIGSLLFFIGVMFGYYVIAPLSVNFLGNYHVSEEIENTFTIGSYISTVSTITLAAGIIFELPIIVYFLTKIGIVTPVTMRKYRRHSIVAVLILSAIITPPDVVSQILVALPLVVLYEISIRISKIVIKNKEEND